MRRLHPVVTLTVLTLALGGCTAQSSSSSEDFKGDEADVAKVVADIESAGKKADGEEICGKLFTKELADSLKADGESCTDQMQETIQDVNDFALEVTDVTVSGATATAKVRQGDGDDAKTATFEFARDGKTWRATSLRRLAERARTGARSTRGSRRSGSAPTTTRCRGTSSTVRSSPSAKYTCGSQPSARIFSERERVAAVVAGAVGDVLDQLVGRRPVYSMIRSTTSRLGHSSGPPTL